MLSPLNEAKIDWEKVGPELHRHLISYHEVLVRNEVPSDAQIEHTAFLLARVQGEHS